MNPDARPLSIYLKVTNRCNLRCPHCYQSSFRGDMAMDTIRQVHRRYPNARIILHGGEPTLVAADGIRRAIDILGERTYIIQSNLIHISTALPGLISEHFGSQIGTSFDTGRLPHVNKILRNTSQLAEKGIGVSAIITVTEDLTLKTMESFIEGFQEAGGSGFRLQFVTPVKGAPVRPSQYLKAFRTFLDHPLNSTTRRTVNASCTGMAGINGGNCAEVVRTVNPNGTVYVCPEFAGQNVFPLGHITGRLRDRRLCLVPEFYQREKKLALQCCREYWHLCRGGCVSNAFFSAGHTGRDPFCAIYRKILGTGTNGG
jgi:radical SAM protein with 4Fe4S-binding SPASM domain